MAARVAPSPGRTLRGSISAVMASVKSKKSSKFSEQVKARLEKKGREAFKKLSVRFLGAIQHTDEEAIKAALVENQALIEGGYLDLNEPLKKTKSTFLHTACYYHKPQLVRFLVAHGAKPNVQTLKGYTPLHFACEHITSNRQECTEIVNILLRAGADPNIKTHVDGHMSAYDTIAKHGGSDDRKWLKDLAKETEDVRMVNDEQLRSWRAEITQQYKEAHANASPRKNSAANTPRVHDVTKEKRGARVFKELKQLFKQKKEELSQAAVQQLLDDNQQLIDEGYLNLDADINRKGQKLLHLAVWFRKKVVVEVLLKRGANPNTVNIRGNTPLHVACDYAKAGDTEIIQLLLEYGADRTVRNYMHGATPSALCKIDSIREFVDSWKGSTTQNTHKPTMIESLLARAAEDDEQQDLAKARSAQNQEEEMRRKLAAKGHGGNVTAHMVEQALEDERKMEEHLKANLRLQEDDWKKKLKRKSMGKANDKSAAEEQVMEQLFSNVAAVEVKQDHQRSTAEEEFARKLASRKQQGGKAKPTIDSMIQAAMTQGAAVAAQVQNQMQAQDDDFLAKLARGKERQKERKAKKHAQLADELGVRELFHSLDANASGHLSTDTLWELHRQLHGCDVDREVMQETVNAVGNGDINPNNVLQVLQSAHIACRRTESLQWDFRIVEPERAGALDPRRNTVAELLWAVNYDEKNRMHADRDPPPYTLKEYLSERGDDRYFPGVITYEEFQRALLF